MEIARYIFQSPYSSQVQVGRPDPSVKKEETQESKEDNTVETQGVSNFGTADFQNTQAKSNSVQRLIDVYA